MQQQTGETSRRRHPHNAATYDQARRELMAAQHALTKKEKEELLQQTTLMGDRIAQAMEDNGTSNRELSILMEVGERTVSDWKKDGTISLKRLPLLARHLNTSVEFLITGETTEFLKHRPSDDNVVEFNREAGFEGVNMPLIDRFLPAISTAEIGMGMDHVQSIIKEYSTNHGDRLGISVAFFNPDVPGIPKYCMQIILPEFKEDMPLGTMIGLADDISPIPGDFIVGKNNGKLVAGFIFPVGGHIASSNRSQSYLDLDQFIVCKRLLPSTVMDITCTHETFELIGVCTYKANWLSPSLIEEQTHLRDRMKTAFESRRLAD